MKTLAIYRVTIKIKFPVINRIVHVGKLLWGKINFSIFVTYTTL